MSQTTTIELEETQYDVKRLTIPSRIHQRSSPSSIKSQPHSVNESRRLSTVLPSEKPTAPEPTSETWNSSRGNIARVSCAFYCLLLMGMNDAAYGIEDYYHLSYTVVSLIFLSPFAGYMVAAFANNALHMKFGQRGIAIIAPLCKILGYVVLAVHPPYPVIVFMFMAVGFGLGAVDAAWNAWIGDMANANQLLGILHACYGIGGTISPLVATTLITKAGWSWYMYYYILVGLSCVELVVCTAAFWSRTGTVFRQTLIVATAASEASGSEAAGNSRMKESLLKRPFARVTWVCAVFLMIYIGTEVSIGGWLVVFMMRERNGTAFASGLVATGFWLGLSLGRVTLGFVTPKIGEKLAISIYTPISMALQLLFWLVPNFTSSAIFMGLEGFFLGPLFPAAIVVMTKLLPKRLHVAAIGFSTAFGSVGGALFPFAVGAIAQASSVGSLQPIIFAMLAAILATWLRLPRLKKRD